MNTPDERGFTLVELIVAVSILGVVMGAITAAIVVGLKTTDDTITRLSESHDTQISTAYFNGDAQSAESVELSVNDPCIGENVLALFSWTDPHVTPAVAKTASYVITTPASGRELHRRYCEGSALKSDVVVAHNLHPTAAPSISCTPSCLDVAGRSVTMTVTDASSYAYTLTGLRRTT